MLLALTAPTDKAANLMADLGIQVYDANGKTRDFRDILGNLETAFKGMSEQDRNAAMKDIFGTDAIRAANILLDEGVAGWDKFTKEMADAPTVMDMSKAKLNTLGGAIEQFKGSLETLQILIGEKFLPVLTAMGLAGVNALNWILDGSALSALQKLGKALLDLIPQTYVTAMKTSFLDIVTTVRDGAEDILNGFKRLASWISDNWAAIWDKVGPVVMAALELVGDDIKNVFGVIEGTVKLIMGILTLDWQEAWDGAVKVLSSAKDLLVDHATNMGKLVIAALELLRDGAVAAFKAIWDFAGEPVEVVEHFAGQLPARLTARLLGFPEKMAERQMSEATTYEHAVGRKNTERKNVCITRVRETSTANSSDRPKVTGTMMAAKTRNVHKLSRNAGSRSISR